VYAQNPNIVYAVIDNYNALPDTAKKKSISDTVLQLKDFKTMTAEQLLNLEDKKLDTFMQTSIMKAVLLLGLIHRQASSIKRNLILKEAD
jgi:hypothetical protein